MGCRERRRRTVAPSSRFHPVAGTRAVLALLLLAWAPRPAAAQFGIVEGFARNVSQMSFYFGRTAVRSSSPEVRQGGLDATAFGVELLFPVRTITRPLAGAPRPAPTDSIRRILKGMDVILSDGSVDTIYHYDIEPVAPPSPPVRTLWALEVGLGYGQISGFDLADPGLDMNASVRDLPALSLYANYAPWGNYFGLRTGFMKTEGLQVADTRGEEWKGEGEAFLFGALTGWAFGVEGLWLLLETGYTVRRFPSVEWRGSLPLPSGIPRDLDVSGWFVSGGIQFPLR